MSLLPQLVAVALDLVCWELKLGTLTMQGALVGKDERLTMICPVECVSSFWYDDRELSPHHETSADHIHLAPTRAQVSRSVLFQVAITRKTHLNDSTGTKPLQGNHPM